MELNVGATNLTMESKKLILGWIDYSMFSGLLGISLLIGIYFGFCHKQDSTSQYLFGGKDMNYIAVATSIIASFLSGITFLGVPTEVYLHGSQYFAVIISTLIIGLISSFVVMPHFYKLQISSSYEYLELRFTKSIRIFAATLYILSLFFYIPIVIYVPALAFSQLTGFNIHLVSPFFILVCITYTSMGGIKAVVWTDTIQFFFTVAGLVAVIIIGLISIGGFSELWRIADEGHRIQLLNMDPSPFKRDTFWAITIGLTVTLLSRFGLGQKFVQRMISIKKESNMKKAIIISSFGLGILQFTCVFLGLLMYAKYHNCDPLKAKLIDRSDQTLPYYVMDIAGHLHGLPGLFLSGIVSSALSTMSASLNTISGIIYNTYIARFLAEGPKKDSKAANIIKIISILAGLVTVGLVFLVERLGTIFEMAMSLSSVTEGALLGLFTVGMLLPWVGKTGAMMGGCASLVIMGWIIGGTQWYILNKRILYTSLPTSAEACPHTNINETLMHKNASTNVESPLNPDEEPMFLYRIAVLYFTLLGSVIVIVVASATSYFIGETDLSKVNPEHILPIMRRFLPQEKFYAEVPIKEIKVENTYDAKNHK